MSSNLVELSSEHSESQNYARDTPANQRLVNESHTTTSEGPSSCEGIEAASVTPQVAPAGSTPKKKKKKSLVKGVKIPISSEATPSVPSSGAKSKDKEGEIPTILRDSLPVKLNQSHLQYLREYYSILDSVEMRLLSGAYQVYKPLVARGVEDGPLSPGWTSIYVQSFIYGARFPLSPFTNELLLALNRAPDQIYPMGWLYLTVFHVICGIVKVKPNMPLFCQLFMVLHTGVTTSLSPAKGWNIFMDEKPGKVAEIRWHALWFFIKGGMEAKVPKKWVDAKRANRPRAEPTVDTFAALAKLKTFFRQKLHWKIFCEEWVMIAANLVPDHEFDTFGNPIPWAPILLASKETFLPNLVPLYRMKGKRPIAFKKLKVVKKGVSSPRSSPGVAATQRSSPIAAEPISSIQPDLQRSSSSPSQAERRPARKKPSEGTSLQGLDKRPRTSPEPEDLPKSGIPPPAFPDFELVKRANSLDFENQRLLAQLPSEKEVSLEEELAKLKEEYAKSQRISSSILATKRKINEDYLGLHKRFEDVSTENQKLKDESSGFDYQITQLSADAVARHPKEIWAVVENYKQSAELRETVLAAVEEFKESKEFEAAISAAVERFKTSPEFVYTLGANAAFWAFSFVKNYKEKYPELRSDFAEFQEDYKNSWFANLDLDASSSEEENEEDALLLAILLPPLSFFLFISHFCNFDKLSLD
ncbi:hypothetical protein LIER_08550 [Lithospermum erythrorhizon]|uniref:Transposase (putative) gypsy type domain-containing protein n=1 Tax=Lithospermum erythrorhizon TaxID=34254 RepID=A0AAV3PH31_LITER